MKGIYAKVAPEPEEVLKVGDLRLKVQRSQKRSRSLEICQRKKPRVQHPSSNTGVGVNMDPAVDPVASPSADGDGGAAADPALDPAPDPVADPAADPVADPAADSSADGGDGAVAAPATDSSADGGDGAMAAPATDPVASPSADGDGGPAGPLQNPVAGPVASPSADGDGGPAGPVRNPVAGPVASPSEAGGGVRHNVVELRRTDEYCSVDGCDCRRITHTLLRVLPAIKQAAPLKSVANKLFTKTRGVCAKHASMLAGGGSIYHRCRICYTKASNDNGKPKPYTHLHKTCASCTQQLLHLATVDNTKATATTTANQGETRGEQVAEQQQQQEPLLVGRPAENEQQSAAEDAEVEAEDAEVEAGAMADIVRVLMDPIIMVHQYEEAPIAMGTVEACSDGVCKVVLRRGTTEVRVITVAPGCEIPLDTYNSVTSDLRQPAAAQGSADSPTSPTSPAAAAGSPGQRWAVVLYLDAPLGVQRFTGVEDEALQYSDQGHTIADSLSRQLIALRRAVLVPFEEPNIGDRLVVLVNDTIRSAPGMHKELVVLRENLFDTEGTRYHRDRKLSELMGLRQCRTKIFGPLPKCFSPLSVPVAARDIQPSLSARAQRGSGSGGGGSGGSSGGGGSGGSSGGGGSGGSSSGSRPTAPKPKGRRRTGGRVVPHEWKYMLDPREDTWIDVEWPSEYTVVDIVAG
ncbi:hypothetical protein PLESTB_000879400 [Pleodorina starrii]|uniref:Uncharacterized protein n=1 Tax=Pleodorina starrii TaxID=330485 RepID=A0A9W6BLU6_9CHLO|nr:hypothetical protein PLESTB_000879400 [Pleodorina starrii]